MDKFHQQILVLFSIPIYAVLIPLEILMSHLHHSKAYTIKDTLMNIYLNLVNAGVDLLLRAVALFVLFFFYQYKISIAFNPIVYWVLLFLLEDVLFWLEHYVDHKVRIFWAVHVTHHSSEEYNLTTGFRSSVLMPFYRYLYFIPLALMGFRPQDILFVYAITQIYGILVHTKAIKKLPSWIEYLFVTPSHHRVHHASNILYLDKNMGMVLIIWDRIFGTFQKEEEQEPPVYGILHPLPEKFHPVKIIFHEWQLLWQEMKQTTGWKNKISLALMPPGWRSDGKHRTARILQKELRMKRSQEF